MRKRLPAILALVLMAVNGGCTFAPGTLTTEFVSPLQIGIARHPEPADFGRGALKKLPSYNQKSTNNWQVDLRGYDLSALSIDDDRLTDLLHADFDSRTKWPGQLPDGFEPDTIMNLGKDPGLGVRQLHQMGITGKGVGIAIIDQTLLVDHVEYRDRLRHYEELHNHSSESQMHGSAVASIAVGKTVGVAPEADLYYIAEDHGDFTIFGARVDFTWLAKSIDRILEINRTLPQDKRIRVLSISVGWVEDDKGYQEVVAAVQRAKEDGIFVVSSSLRATYDYSLAFHGLGRDVYADPNDPNSYGPGAFWAKSFYDGSAPMYESLLVPMDTRCTASPTGEEDYVYYADGGWSWAIPYIAGLYALACQVKPDITPEEFWEAGLKTGDTVSVTDTLSLGKIVNPVRLIQELSGRE